MPFIVEKTDACPASRPWGVFTETAHGSGKSQGRPHGCFATKTGARQQQKALYANVPDARSEPVPPPNLRDGSGKKRCENCKMFWRENEERTAGKCWGYNNFGVRTDQVCDSFDPETTESKSDPGTSEVPMDPTTILDAPRLQTAIASLARAGSSHDEERRALIERARVLGHSDLLPDNWQIDGTLVNRDGVWETDEQRETYENLRVALCDAVQDYVEDMDGCYYGFVQDFDESRVYFQAGGALYAASYSVEAGGPVTISDAARVRPVTSYVPAERSEEDRAAERKRRHPRIARTLEYRREKAEALSRGDRRRADPRPSGATLELRAENPETGVRVLRSYASLFNTPYTIRGSSHRYEERVLPGAFKRSLSQSPDVVLRVNHLGPPLAATWNETLRLGEDERGLWYEADLQVGADPEAKSVAAKIERGDMRESSFAFRCLDDDWSDDFSQRGVREASLDRGDVSVVTFGASRATGEFMLLRSEEQIVEALRDLGFEHFLDALVDWRNYTLLPQEQRIGKVLSSESMETLRQILGLVANADDSIDEAEEMLSDLMGVPNPDEDDGEESEESGTVTASEQLAHVGRTAPAMTQRSEAPLLIPNDTDDLRFDLARSAM